MTSIIGILCSDGVVIGSDSSATSSAGQMRIMEQKTVKIKEINGKLVAGTGSIGLSQRLEAVIGRLEQKKGEAIKYCRTIAANCLEDFKTTGIEPRYQNVSLGALLAFADGESFKLCEFELLTFQPELKTKQIWHASMGSGQPITDPMIALLKGIFWEKTQPNVNEGVFMTLWALQHVIEINAGGINGPIQIATLSMDKSRGAIVNWLDEEALMEHKQNVEECKAALQEVENRHKNSSIILPQLEK